MDAGSAHTDGQVRRGVWHSVLAATVHVFLHGIVLTHRATALALNALSLASAMLLHSIAQSLTLPMAGLPRADSLFGNSCSAPAATFRPCQARHVPVVCEAWRQSGPGVIASAFRGVSHPPACTELSFSKTGNGVPVTNHATMSTRDGYLQSF